MNINWYFKHSNTAHEGRSIQDCLDMGKPELIAYYWIILELVSRYETFEDRGKLQISKASLMRILRKKAKTVQECMNNLCTLFSIEVEEIPDGFYSIRVPKWLELQETRGGKKRAKKEQKNDVCSTDKRQETKDKRQKNNTSTSDEVSLSEKILKIWNENCGSLAKIIKIDRNRTAKLNMILKEYPDVTLWEKAVKLLAASPFHTGTNDRGWRATFDFLLQKGRMTQILEFENKSPKAKEFKFE